MKTSDIVKKVKSSEVEESMLDRDSSIGGGVELGALDDEDDDFSDFFSDDDGGGNIGNTDFNTVGSQGSLLGGGQNSSLLGGGNSFTPFGAQMQQPQQQQNQKSTEDMIFEVGASAMKGSVSYLKEFGKSFSGLKARFWTKYGSNMIIVGGVSCVVGVVSLFVLREISYNFLVGGILDLITGVGCLTFFYDRAKYEENQPVETFNNSLSEGSQDDEIDLDDDEEDSLLYGDDEEEDDELNLFDDEDDDDELDLFGSSSESSESEDLYDSLFKESSSSNSSTDDTEEVLEKMEKAEEELDNIQENTLYTRQYLYEKISPVLEHLDREYDTMRTINEDSEEFKSLNHIVSVAGKQIASAQEDIPYLLSASENAIYIKLDIQRTKATSAKSKLDILCEEIANILKIDEETGSIPEENEGIYATGVSVGEKVIVKVYKGESSIISIKDIMEKEREFFLNPKNKIPCAIGVNNDGVPVLRDFKDIESILMTGFPRSGKTWATLAILTQLAMWNSPKDIQFYICDPKNELSDFKYFYLPHVRKFAYKDSDILETMRQLVMVEGERRKSIVGKNTNIWNFKSKNPNIELPVIYVIVDEVVTLADRMDKDTKKEFQEYLRMLITQLPAVGIRAILVPHEIKHDIINKTTTNSIPCRFSVKGDANHIKQNVTTDKFEHLLRCKGDMAVKLPDADTKFVKSAVLSNSNEKNQQLFSFLGKLWSKLEPDTVKGSLAEVLIDEKEMNKMLNDTIENVDNTEISFDDIAGEKPTVDLASSGIENARTVDEVVDNVDIDDIDDFFNGGEL